MKLINSKEFSNREILILMENKYSKNCLVKIDFTSFLQKFRLEKSYRFYSK